MLIEAQIGELTCRVTSSRTGLTYTAVRPGLGLAMYYGKPLHAMPQSWERIIDAYIRFVPKGAITALCGRDGWGPYTPARLRTKVQKLKNSRVDYTNIDLGSGPLLGSAGPYGWHLSGGNLSGGDVFPNNSNVCFHECPPDELDRVGTRRMVDWVVSVAELAPFETGQFGYSFNQLQRTWTSEADELVGDLAMRFRGFDILEPDLAREARGSVPNCSWLNLLGEAIVQKLGGESAIRAALSSAVQVHRIAGGLLLQAGERPPVGDMRDGGSDLETVREVARLTKPLRVMERVLFYGMEEFRHGWVHRLDVT